MESRIWEEDGWNVVIKERLTGRRVKLEVSRG